jgi:hypothetical protein
MVWLGLSAAMLIAIVLLWWWAWRQRKVKPPKPTQPYREWKD